MRIDGSMVLIAALIVALAGLGVWQYRRVHALHYTTPPQESVRVPLVF